LRLSNCVFARDLGSWSELLFQQLRPFSQRQRVFSASAQIKNISAESVHLIHLQFHKSANVFQKKNVADLFPVPADILQRQPEIMSDRPPHNPSLIQFSELPC